MTCQTPAFLPPWQLLMVSAKSERALDSLTSNLIDFLRRRVDGGNADLADVSFTLLAGRELFDLRRAVVCGGREDAIRVLEGYHPNRLLTATSTARNRKVAFSFTDRNATALRKAPAIHASQPIFRTEIDRCIGLLPNHLAAALHRLFVADGTWPSAVDPVLEHLAVFILQYALARLWLRWGLHPDALIGEGTGECVAAHLAGCISLDDALYLATARGQVSQPGVVDAEGGAARTGRMSAAPPRIPYASGITGTWIGPVDIGRSEYWLELAQPRSGGALPASGLVMGAERLILDIGSGTLIDGSPKPMGDPAADGSCWLLATLGALAVSGAKIDWKAHFADKAVKRIPLPTYPFEPRRHWFAGAKETPDHPIAAAMTDPLADNAEPDRVTSAPPAGRHAAGDGSAGRPPRNSQVEDFLIATCRDLLGIESIGLHDNVMQLGMDSMNVMQLSLTVNEVFHISLAPHHLFSRPDLASVAEKILALRPDLATGCEAPSAPARRPLPGKEENHSSILHMVKFVESLSDAEVDGMLRGLGVLQGNEDE